MGESPSTGKHDGEFIKQPSGRWVKMIAYQPNCVAMHAVEEMLFLHIAPCLDVMVH